MICGAIAPSKTGGGAGNRGGRAAADYQQLEVTSPAGLSPSQPGLMTTRQAIVVVVVVVVVVGYAEQPGFVSVHARGELELRDLRGCRHRAAGY